MGRSDAFSRDEVRLKPSRPKKFKRAKLLRTRRHLGGKNYAPRPRSATCFANLGFLKAGSGSSSKLSAHLSYLARESAATRDPEQVHIFGNCSPDSFRQFLPKEKRIFKLVLSPEDVFTMNPHAFVDTFMSRVQAAAGLNRRGQSFDWVGFLHTNTAHPHVHIVIRGLDHSGRDVFLSPILARGLRRIAQNVQEVVGGLPTITYLDHKEVRASERLQPLRTRNRWNVDRYIERLPHGTSYSDALALVPIPRRRAFHARLSFFEKVGVLRISKDGQIAVDQDFASRFRELRHLAAEVAEAGRVRYCNPFDLRIGGGSTGSDYGLVTGIHYSPDRKQHWAILETLNTEPVLVEIPASLAEKILFWSAQKTVVRLKGGVLEAMKGNPIARVKKLRAKGPVVNAILGVESSAQSRSALPDLAQKEQLFDGMDL